MNEQIIDFILPQPREIKFTGGHVAGDSGALRKIIRLDDPAMPPEAYRLAISSVGVTVRSGSASGAFYAQTTLRQILAGAADAIPCMEINDAPAIAVRGVHICCHKGHRPSFETIKQTVKILAGWKINLLVLENDDGFPWQRHPAIAGPYAWSMDQIAELRAVAAAHHVQLAPLLNSFGHAQAYLCHPQYAHLRESPDLLDEMCPSHPDTLKFVMDMWADLFTMFPESKYAMIGGDEVFRHPGGCERCQPYHASDRLAELYGEYYTKLSRWVLAQGRQPIVWGDMLIKYPEANNKFPRDVIIGDWQYHAEDSDTWSSIPNRKRPDGRQADERLALFGPYWGAAAAAGHCREFPYYKYFRDQGFVTWGVTLSEEETASIPMPSPSWSILNNKRFAMTIAANGGAGMINTNWGMSPLDAAWAGLAAGAEYGWHPRNESPAEFMRRFAICFTGDADLGGRLLEFDKKITARRHAFLTNAWLDVTFLSTSEFLITAVHTDARTYVALQNWNIRACAWAGGLGQIFNQIDGLLTGTASYRPADLAPFLNGTNAECTPSTICLRPPAGRQKPMGIDFDLADGRLITMDGGVAPVQKISGIPIAGCPDRIYLLLAGYNLMPGAQIVEIVFNHADGSDARMPLVGGENLPEWTIRPVRAVSRAILAYAQDPKGLWITWVDNAGGKHIKSLEVCSGTGSGRLMLYGVTPAYDLVLPAIDPVMRANFECRIRTLVAQADELRRALAGLYREMGMSAPDIESGVKKSLVSAYCNAAANYLDKLRRIDASCNR